MTTLTLLIRVYNTHQLRHIDTILADLVEGLDVQASVLGTLANRWVQVEVSGEDEGVATKLLERDTGFCPVSLENVKKFASLKGFVTGLDKNKDALTVDIGVVEPATVHALVPLKHLQANFANGKGVTLKRISELWGLCENLPLNIKVLNVKAEENFIEAELQDSQIRKLQQWKESLLDRLIVLGASKDEVNSAIEQGGIKRDIIDVETLGTFEHALVCKLGTDAAGLIRSIGSRLRKAKFTIFNPKKIIAAQTAAETKTA